MTKEQRKVWRKNNPDKHREEQRRYYALHKDFVGLRVKKRKRRFPDREKAYSNSRRTRQTNAGGVFNANEWFTLCFACAFRCLCCGKKSKLTADHVVPVSKGGSSYLHNIQSLCQACNGRKHDGTTDYRDQPFWLKTFTRKEDNCTPSSESLAGCLPT